MSNLISRQAAIDALADMHYKSDEDGYVWIIRSDAWARIDALPTAEPEIIRCKDCKHWDTEWDKNWTKNYHYCPYIGGTSTGDWYCADAERKLDD